MTEDGALADDEYSHDVTAVASPMWGRDEAWDYMAAGGVTEEGAARGEEEAEEGDAMGGKFRLGMFIDRLIGWSVFAEDGETDSEGEGGAEEVLERERLAKEREKERIRFAGPEEEKLREAQRRRRDQDEGWQDPAWVFSIASNVLF